RWTAWGMAALLALLAPGVALAQGTWLDGPLEPWNTAGASIPHAPHADPPPQERCREQEREAANDEEARVAAAGWILERYWPTERQGDVAIVTALSNYDGMCRPMGFNTFVFVAGAFAGTIAPVPMDSRTDGVVRDLPTLRPDGTIEAVFLRYAPSDPLCCPSLPSIRVTYRIERVGGAPVLVPDRASTADSTADPLPAQPARAGEPMPWMPALGVGVALLALGLALRRASSNGR
ncbi:MAG TPA: LppP/LprE family lipoprotein, partial [Chloroflexota bacterium]